MTVSVADFAAFLNASAAEPTLPTVLAEAQRLVADHLGPAAVTVPGVVLDLAVKQLGSELFARRNAGPGGVAQWGPDGQPVRLARDPLASVRPLLSPYRGLGTPG